jgi:two-component system response regulator NreC
VLAARDAVVRAELRRMLDSAPGLQVVAEAGDAKTAIEAVARHAPAALVLNLGGPGDIAALDTIRAVEAACPATRVIVRARQDDARFVRHALTAGAAACLLDDLQGDDLIEAVRAAAAPDDLTEREIEVLRLLALGHTNPEIAARLQLSVRTVEAHRAHLQHKLSRPSRAELVRYALQRGLLRATEDPARG